MFVVMVDFAASPGAETHLREALLRQAANSLAKEERCRRFDVCCDADDSGQFVLYEIYDSRADFDAHLSTDHFIAFDEQTRPMVASKTVRFLTLAEAV